MRKIYISDYLFGFMILSVFWTFISGYFLAGFWFAGPLCLFPVFILFSLIFLVNIVTLLFKHKTVDKIQSIYFLVSLLLFLADYYLIFITHILDINLHIG